MTDRLFHAPWLITVARVFASAGKPVYAVGGAVRNALMGLPASDVDLCGPTRPEEILRLCEGTPIRAVLRAAHFGTVELHAADTDGRHMAEYTTFRVDSYRTGHQPVAVRFADTVDVDALRRDFSVNALYRPLWPDPETPAEVLDPTGGISHMQRGILHTVTPDPDLVLRDDGLRILRAARFQAELGFTPTEALLASAARHAHLLDDIAMERLRDELTRLLLADTRYPTLPRREPPIPAGLATVRRTGAWRALFGLLLPEDAPIAATAFYHPPEGMPPVSGKLALLHSQAEPDALAAQMTLLRYSARETSAAATALTLFKRIGNGRCTLMEAVRLGLPALAHAEAAYAALLSAGAPCEAEYLQTQALCASLHQDAIPKSLRELAIRGNDLQPMCRALGLPASAIGQTLDALWQAAVERGIPNRTPALLQEARRLLAEKTKSDGSGM